LKHNALNFVMHNIFLTLLNIYFLDYLKFLHEKVCIHFTNNSFIHCDLYFENINHVVSTQTYIYSILSDSSQISIMMVT